MTAEQSDDDLPDGLQPRYEVSLWHGVITASYLMSILALTNLSGIGHPVVIMLMAVGVQWILRHYWLASDHYKGIGYASQGNYRAAIDCFKNSFAHFSRHPILDALRPITLLSMSKLSFREEAMLNGALCHIKMGEYRAAQDVLEEMAGLFPGSVRAEAALRDLKTIVQ